MVISVFILILGFMVLREIPISQYPDITPPMIKITGSYNGANSVNVEQAVATPIEQQVNGVEKMLYMQSINANDGSTTIQVSFLIEDRKRRQHRKLIILLPSEKVASSNSEEIYWLPVEDLPPFVSSFIIPRWFLLISLFSLPNLKLTLMAKLRYGYWLKEY
jgi:multidrug efflux pump subunit AcrB